MSQIVLAENCNNYANTLDQDKDYYSNNVLEYNRPFLQFH